MKVISFNANGIRSAAKKGFFEWLKIQDADLICIQETKAWKSQLEDPVFFPSGYYCAYSDAIKKGYSGVAIYAKKEPHAIVQTIGIDYVDEEGRYLQFDYPSFSIASIYFPSGTSGEARQAVKYAFLETIEQRICDLLKTGKELILCGDYNIAHKEIDLKNWKGNLKNSGFLPQERAWMEKLLTEIGLIDAFRVVNTSENEYTWWSNRGRAREKNVGWRIDYQVVTPNIANLITEVSVYRDVFFSDHAPLLIHYREDLCAKS